MLRLLRSCCRGLAQPPPCSRRHTRLAWGSLIAIRVVFTHRRYEKETKLPSLGISSMKILPRMCTLCPLQGVPFVRRSALKTEMNSRALNGSAVSDTPQEDAWEEPPAPPSSPGSGPVDRALPGDRVASLTKARLSLAGKRPVPCKEVWNKYLPSHT